jgi:hypothetical protein
MALASRRRECGASGEQWAVRVGPLRVARITPTTSEETIESRPKMMRLDLPIHGSVLSRGFVRQTDRQADGEQHMRHYR